MSLASQIVEELENRGMLRKKFTGSYTDEVEAAVADVIQNDFMREHRQLNPYLYDGKHARYSCDPYNACLNCR